MELKDERPIVVGIGEALLDRFIDDTKNQDNTKRIKKEELGGAPLIFAYHAAHTHCRGVIVSALGLNAKGELDRTGRKIKKELERINLWEESKQYIFEVENRRSGTVIVNDSDKNNPLYNIKINSAWSNIPWKNSLKDLAEKTVAVYFGPLASFCGKSSKGTSKQTIDTFIDIMPNECYVDAVPKECYKIFDVNLRHNPNKKGKHNKELYDEELIRKYIGKCNVLKANTEELDYVSKIFNINIDDCDKKEKNDALGKKLLDCCANIKILILTKGKEGSTIFWRNEEDKRIVFSQSIHISVEPENTVGAGDAMVGAFIGGLLNGKSIPDAHYLAALRSDKVCREGKSMPKLISPYVFISYSRKDEEVVSFFCKKFDDDGIKYWRDLDNLECGDVVPNEIIEAIKNCKAFVYFSSKNATESETVKNEIDKAISHNKKIFIVKLDITPFPEKIQSYSKKKQYSNFAKEYDALNKKVNKFVNQIGNKIAKT